MSRTHKALFLVRTLATLSLTSGCVHARLATTPGVETHAEVTEAGSGGLVEVDPATDYEPGECEEDLRSWPYCKAPTEQALSAKEN